MTDKDREAFEAWAKDAEYQSSVDGSFDYPLGRVLWEAFQAATAAERERAARERSERLEWKRAADKIWSGE